MSLLLENNSLSVIVTSNCTALLQHTITFDQNLGWFISPVLPQSYINVLGENQDDSEEKDSSRVEIAGVKDKCQITVTVAGTLSGKLLW